MSTRFHVPRHHGVLAAHAKALLELGPGHAVHTEVGVIERGNARASVMRSLEVPPLAADGSRGR